MRKLKVIVAPFALMSVLAFAAPAPQGANGSREHARELLDRTQNDLRRAEDLERRKGKEISRYENAGKHLSDFDRELTKNHFDKGKLGDLIGDLKDVVEHNTLDPESRDALRQDLGDLRVLKIDRD
jgi:hypothetical protein